MQAKAPYFQYVDMTLPMFMGVAMRARSKSLTDRERMKTFVTDRMFLFPHTVIKTNILPTSETKIIIEYRSIRMLLEAEEISGSSILRL